METERSTDVGTPSAELTTTDSNDLGEVVNPTDVTDEVDALASTIVIPDMERRAEEARASADPDAIQDIQDEYNDARRTRAERIIRRKREKQ
jgi:hypothetical protein